jgi:hypothetical protein
MGAAGEGREGRIDKAEGVRETRAWENPISCVRISIRKGVYGWRPGEQISWEFYDSFLSLIRLNKECKALGPADITGQVMVVNWPLSGLTNSQLGPFLRSQFGDLTNQGGGYAWQRASRSGNINLVRPTEVAANNQVSCIHAQPAQPSLGDDIVAITRCCVKQRSPRQTDTDRPHMLGQLQSEKQEAHNAQHIMPDRQAPPVYKFGMLASASPRSLSDFRTLTTTPLYSPASSLTRGDK